MKDESKPFICSVYYHSKMLHKRVELEKKDFKEGVLEKGVGNNKSKL
jgi:hypothetical protein